jgi:hypothetical protein
VDSGIQIYARRPVSDSVRLSGAAPHRDLLYDIVIVTANNTIKRNLLPCKNGLCDFRIAKIFLKMVFGREAVRSHQFYRLICYVYGRVRAEDPDDVPF